MKAFTSKTVSCEGFCALCGTRHTLAAGPALEACRGLMDDLERHGRIDWQMPEGDPRLSIAPLFGEARGQMFGVMVFRDADGTHGVSKAFSGQFSGVWSVEGWAPPLVDQRSFDNLSEDIEPEIKRLGRRINRLDVHDPLRVELKRMRRELSSQLMRELHDLYTLTDFRGNTAPIRQVFQGSGIPTGTGDCCAPKLLRQAALNGWRPLGIAEFFWGRENRSGSRQHGRFYPACDEKCRPIMGFLLCGLQG